MAVDEVIVFKVRVICRQYIPKELMFWYKNLETV
jgi:hypothetical protein